MFKIIVLGSGSKGNAIYVDIDGIRILLDCGFTKKEINKRLETIGRSMDDIHCIFITHDHGDHLHPWLKKCQFPTVVPTPAISSWKIKDKHEIQSFPLSHDSDSGSFGYTIKDKDGNKVAILMDTGCVPEEVIPYLFDCSVIMIETNYDVDMLAGCSYPSELMDRIASDQGHLRNECAAEVVEMVAGPKLEYVVCMHLSSSNNHSELAKFCINSVISGVAFRPEVVVSDQKKPTKLMVVM